MDPENLAALLAPWLGGDRAGAVGPNGAGGAGAEAGPIGARLSLAMRRAIATGLLEPGQRLPPERELARALHVSRPTISAVTQELRSAGLLMSRQGSGTWVASDVAPATTPVPFAEMVHGTGLIDLAAATAPDASMLPPIRIDTQDLLTCDPPNGFDPVGAATLRELVAERASRWTPGVTAANVVMTAGAHQALALLIATLVPRGGTVLVEDTTYGGLVDLVRSYGAHTIGVPMDDAGPDPAALRRLVASSDPALIVLIASVHSPTGRISPDERCAELAEVLAAAPCPVVIDETYTELEFELSGRRLVSMLGDSAIRVGSLSKTVWSGLRVGWVIGSDSLCASLVRSRWSMFDLGIAVASQLVAEQVMADLDQIIDGRRASLRQRSRLLIDGLHARLPWCRASEPQGGLAVWVDVGEDGQIFADRSAAAGVAVLPGSASRCDREPTDRVRFCFDQPPAVIEEALDRLAVAHSADRVGGGEGE